MRLTLKMTLEHQYDFRNGFLAPQNIRKVILYEDLVILEAEISYSHVGMLTTLNLWQEMTLKGSLTLKMTLNYKNN